MVYLHLIVILWISYKLFIGYLFMMHILDQFIDTAINRLSSEDGTMVSQFFIDLRAHFSDRQRITQKLINDVITLCESRGLDATVDSRSNLLITVSLNRCRFNPSQAATFNAALAYTRDAHGNHL